MADDTVPHDRGEDDDTSDQKSYQTILEQEIEAGLLELRRPTKGLLLSGLSAGLDIGFSALLIAVVLSLPTEGMPPAVVELLRASSYSIGFIFVILGRSELFTEHTTLAALPVIGGQASVPRLLRLWGLIYISNTVGAILFGTFAAFILPALGSATPEAFGRIAGHVVDHPGWVILLSAILAGWLMGLLTWLVTAARETISKVFIVWLVTSAIGLANLHHCIVGTVEVTAGVVLGVGSTLAQAVQFLAWATLGNAIGGVIFVALIKYGHASQGGEEPFGAGGTLSRPRPRR